jgi:hypothetical protein
MTAYVINLERRGDRWQKMQAEWGEHFDLVKIPAIDLPGNGAGGCKLSHRMVAIQFLEKEDVILVFEDDAIPTSYFEIIGMDCIKEAKERAHQFDYINCGPYLDLTCIGCGRATLNETTSDLFLRTNLSHQTHMVMYNHASLRLIEKSLKSHLPLDMFLGRYAKCQLVPIHLLATQSDSPSDIPKPVCDAKQLYALSERMLEEAINKEKA